MFKEYNEYQSIKKAYGTRTSKRSGVPLMNHIDEGLIILDQIGASILAKRAYCLHPLYQDDEDLLVNLSPDLMSHFNAYIVALAIEYRSIANNFLSENIELIKLSDEIRLSPIKDVNMMLIADKVQNRKDFELYHQGTHTLSNELDVYLNCG